MYREKMDIITKIEIIAVIAIVIWGLWSWLGGGDKLSSDTYRTYECDYKSTSVAQTVIETKVNGEEVTIKGGIAAKLWFTDPLTMYDSEDNVLANAGDVYGFISQDDHGIYVNGEFNVNMEGNVDLWGNSYKLKDENGDIVATIECNWTDTHGTVRDIKGNVIATYESALGMNDYTVKVCDNDICSDEAMLIIIASYISDVKYDD